MLYWSHGFELVTKHYIMAGACGKANLLTYGQEAKERRKDWGCTIPLEGISLVI
jgi:hypothetical protein